MRPQMIVCAVFAALFFFALGEGAKADSDCCVADQSLTRTDMLYMIYGASFSYDRCGDSLLGGRLREALIAKLESCPFTEDAKLQFYKKLVTSTSNELSGAIDGAHHSLADEGSFANAKQCDQLNRVDVKALREKVRQYDAKLSKSS